MFEQASHTNDEQDDPLFQVTAVWESLSSAARDAGLCGNDPTRGEIGEEEV